MQMNEFMVYLIIFAIIVRFYGAYKAGVDWFLQTFRLGHNLLKWIHAGLKIQTRLKRIFKLFILIFKALAHSKIIILYLLTQSSNSRPISYLFIFIFILKV